MFSWKAVSAEAAPLSAGCWPCFHVHSGASAPSGCLLVLKEYASSASWSSCWERGAAALRNSSFCFNTGVWGPLLLIPSWRSLFHGWNWGSLLLRYEQERGWLMLGHLWRWGGRGEQTFLNQRGLLVLADCDFLNITMDYNAFKNTCPDQVGNPVGCQVFVALCKWSGPNWMKQKPWTWRLSGHVGCKF